MLLLLFLSVFSAFSAPSLAEDLCSVYDPFKVLPDNNKFQIGGAFPLHGPDCKELRPASVQEVVAIQWALTHWNQNPANANAKLGLYAGDTCSRSREALSQSLRFLDSVGYHEPEECRSTLPGAKLLGLICPSDSPSALSLGSLLAVSDLPVAAYSNEAVNALLTMQVANIVSTTPTVSVYVDVLLRLVSSLRSNLVTIVDDGSSSESVARLVSLLRSSDVYVSDVISLHHPHLSQALDDSDSDIIVSILPKSQLFDVVSDPSIFGLHKLWIAIPMEGEGLSEREQKEVLKKGAELELISIQPRSTPLPLFRDYFVRVLKNNYHSYQLLTSYVQQVYNCSSETCNIDKDKMAASYVQSRNTESAILMTYAFASVGKMLSEDGEKEKICAHPSPECTDLIVDLLLSINYEFNINDPSEFAGRRLSFYRGDDNVLLSAGLSIDVLEIFTEADLPRVYHLMTYTTGTQPTVVQSSIRPADQRMRSICSPYRPFCGQCPTVQTVNPDKHYLSIPRHYPMYLMGLFDLHGGPVCGSMDNTDIALPMAFIHTIWTFRQRFPQLGLLENLDMGALLVDSCSSGRQAVESVVRAEASCFRFGQAGRNITIVPGSVFGYISGLRGDSEQALLGFFSSGETQAALVSVSADQSMSRQSFVATPTGRSQALALLRLLNRMKWQFVTVALSEQDPESLSSFRHFERLALDRGICLAEVINIGGSRVDNLPVASNTNVTVVFATSRDASAYLSLSLRSAHKSVHVMMGDAHDWPIHDPSIREAFVGTVSVQPKDIVYPDFREWLQSTTPLTLPEQWFWQYIEQKWKCALTQRSKLSYGKMCSGDELIDIDSLGRMTKAGYLARGVERFLFAMDSVYKKLCPSQSGLCLSFFEKGRPLIQQQLQKASVEDDIDIYEYLPLQSVDNKAQFGYRSIGNWSISTGLRLHSLYRSAQATPPVSLCHPPMCKCFIDGDLLGRPLDSFVPLDDINDSSSLSSGSYVQKQPAFPTQLVAYRSLFEHLSSGEWRLRPHNFVLLAVVSAMTIATVAVLVLVLVKLYLRVVKGNQSLGISLLVGIIMLYVTAYFFIFDPTDIVCRLRVILHGLGYTVCFGVVVAKAVQLSNAETLGFGSGIHISFWNYWLLLFFIVGVQIALSTRWIAERFMSTLGADPSEGDDASGMRCSLAREEFVISNIYVIILLFLALFLNSRNRNIKRNYKETKWLFVSSVVSALIWALWIPAYFFVPSQYKEVVVVLELLCCGSVLLGFLFGPKIYILLSYEPVVVEYKPEQNGNAHALDLFEKDDDDYSMRAVSPASSTSSSQRTAPLGGIREREGAMGGEQSPIFHTVMRKKNKLRRSHSEHQTQQMSSVSGGVAVIRSPSRMVHPDRPPHHPNHS